MELTIINKKKEIVYKTRHTNYATSDDVQRDDVDTQENAYYQTKTREIRLPDLYINDHSLRIVNDIHLHTPAPEAFPSLFFVRQGQIKTKFHFHDENIQFAGGKHSFLYNAFSSEDSYLKQQQRLSMFIVSFSPAYFLKLAEAAGTPMGVIANSVAGNSPGMYENNHGLRITPRMYDVINEMSSCTFEGGLKELFLQAKAVELLALHFAQVSVSGGRKQEKIKLSQADELKLQLAKEILITDFLNPPSLSNLARETGLNEFKLKTGFRIVFNNSVFGYFNDVRLKHCHAQITNTNRPLTEIAYDGGFGSLAHFSHAFKKKYGLSPSRLRS